MHYTCFCHLFMHSVHAAMHVTCKRFQWMIMCSYLSQTLLSHCTGLGEAFIKLAAVSNIQVASQSKLLSTCRSACLASMFTAMSKLRSRVVIALGYPETLKIASLVHSLVYVHGVGCGKTGIAKR